MQLNLVVVFVMVHNRNAVIHKVIAWHFDNLLLSSVKVQTTRISDTGLGAQAYNKNIYIISLEKKTYHRWVPASETSLTWEKYFIFLSYM